MSAQGSQQMIRIRFNDAEAALIERARGGTERSAWIRAVVIRAAVREAHNQDMERRDHASRAYAKEPGFDQDWQHIPAYKAAVEREGSS